MVEMRKMPNYAMESQKQRGFDRTIAKLEYTPPVKAHVLHRRHLGSSMKSNRTAPIANKKIWKRDGLNKASFQEINLKGLARVIR